MTAFLCEICCCESCLTEEFPKQGRNLSKMTELLQ